MEKVRQYPIIILLIINIVIGLFTFDDYGLSWDELLYYDYGKASQYAYSISARLDGSFDLEKSFGASAGDHVTRGPAYLLIAGLLENLLEFFELDIASAWHLTNFITYQIGLVFFYLIIRRWLDAWPATVSTAFFATQPVLWNHAFINPKDIPFSVFFLISIYLGFRMVDAWNQQKQDTKSIVLSTILPGLFLGLATAIRFIAPYAAILVIAYYISTKNWRAIWGIIPYGITALIGMYIFWPFLWPDPIARFAFTLQAMADTSSDLKILFMGNLFRAYELPHRYFPTLLALTLTEPTWPLFLFGLFIGLKKTFQQSKDRARLLIIFFWFGLIISFHILLSPPNSDGYRHYLFMLPPVFIFAGFAINELILRIKPSGLKALAVATLLLPAIIANISLHPYEYTYYNIFIGGTGNAFRQYETDYWLTCYREAVLEFNEQAPQGSRLFVKREPYIAAYYASPNITIRDYRTEFKDIQPGDFILVNTRANEDEQILKDASTFLEIGRGNAIFCVIKQVP